MTTLKRVILNGTTFYPTTIETEDVRITSGGSPVRMLGGSMRIWHIGFKKKFKLHWEAVPETTMSSIRSAYRTTSSITYNDENNTNYTVVTTAFSEELSAEQISRAGIIYYNVDLEMEEV